MGDQNAYCSLTRCYCLLCRLFFSTAHSSVNVRNTCLCDRTQAERRDIRNAGGRGMLREGQVMSAGISGRCAEC